MGPWDFYLFLFIIGHARMHVSLQHSIPQSLNSFSLSPLPTHPIPSSNSSQSLSLRLPSLCWRPVSSTTLSVSASPPFLSPAPDVATHKTKVKQNKCLFSERLPKGSRYSTALEKHVRWLEGGVTVLQFPPLPSYFFLSLSITLTSPFQLPCPLCACAGACLSLLSFSLAIP